MAEGGRVPRRLGRGDGACLVVALLAYFSTIVHARASTWGWERGASTTGVRGIGTRASTPAHQRRSPTGGDLGGTLAIVISFVVTALLYYLKLQFQWWPLHPIAFPLAPASTIQSMTLVIFATWLFKSLLLRYGGPRRTSPPSPSSSASSPATRRCR